MYFRERATPSGRRFPSRRSDPNEALVRPTAAPSPPAGEGSGAVLGRESEGMQALDRSQPMMIGMPRRSHDYGRHGATGLFAAFNIADGTVISELHRQHRAV